MKKLILILTLAAFACSPMIQSTVEAAPVAKASAGKHVKKGAKKHGKKHQKKHRK
jgi:hypothetical protein